MKRRTKNFIEDLLIVISFLFVIYLIYFFVFSQNDESIKETPTQTSQETNTTTNPALEEKSFAVELYEEIKEKFFSTPKEATLEIENKPLENKEPEKIVESSQKHFYTQRADVLIKQEEKVENTNTQNVLNRNLNNNEEEIENKTEVKPENKTEVKSEIKIENKIETNSENKTPTTDLEKDSTKENIEQKSALNSEERVAERISDEQEKHVDNGILNTKPLQDVKTDENSEDDTPKRNIDVFFQGFEKNVYSNIEKNVDKSNFTKGESLSIRITILKDGRYEQLLLISGDTNSFNLVKSSIESLFPLKIEESLKSNFPRYYRMKIDF